MCPLLSLYKNSMNLVLHIDVLVQERCYSIANAHAVIEINDYWSRR